MAATAASVNGTHTEPAEAPAMPTRSDYDAATDYTGRFAEAVDPVFEKLGAALNGRARVTFEDAGMLLMLIDYLKMDRATVEEAIEKAEALISCVVGGAVEGECPNEPPIDERGCWQDGYPH